MEGRHGGMDGIDNLIQDDRRGSLLLQILASFRPRASLRPIQTMA